MPMNEETMTASTDHLFQELKETIVQVAPEELHAFLGKLEEMKSIVLSHLLPTAPCSQKNDAKETDELLEVKEASRKLKVSKNYLYQNSRHLPFTVRVGSRLLFSAQGIDRYIRQNQG